MDRALHDLTLADVLREHRRSRPQRHRRWCAATCAPPIPSSTGGPTAWPTPWSAPGWGRATGCCGWARTATGCSSACWPAPRSAPSSCPANWRQSADELVTLLERRAAEGGDLAGRGDRCRRCAAARARWRAARRWAAATTPPGRRRPEGYEAFLAAALGADDAGGRSTRPSPGHPALHGGLRRHAQRGAALPRGRPRPGVMVALVQRITEDTVYLNSGPMFHMATLMTTFATLHMGGTNVMTRRVDAEELCRIIEAERCNYGFVMGPTAAEIMEVNKDGRYDLSSLADLRGQPGVERDDPGRRQPLGGAPGRLRPDRGHRHAHLQRPGHRERRQQWAPLAAGPGAHRRPRRDRRARRRDRRDRGPGPRSSPTATTTATELNAERTRGRVVAHQRPGPPRGRRLASPSSPR